MGRGAMLLGENLPFFVPVSGGMAHATSAGNRTQWHHKPEDLIHQTFS